MVQSASTSMPEIWGRLQAGDTAAMADFGPSLYRELHRIAARHLRGERPNHTLQPTALIHEAYVKLFDGAPRALADEAHFLALASRAMRQVLVDYARARSTQKRGPGAGNDLPPSLEVANPEGMELLELMELDAALKDLALEDPTIARTVEMKYFGGMTAEEIAQATGQSVHVVRHDLRFAQAWLRRRLVR